MGEQCVTLECYGGFQVSRSGASLRGGRHASWRTLDKSDALGNGTTSAGRNQAWRKHLVVTSVIRRGERSTIGNGGRVSAEPGAVNRDADLMRRLQAGEARAYRELSDLYLRRVLNYSYRMLGNQAEAEEVCQDVFFRLWKLREPWKGDAQVISWLLRVAHNLCTDRLRRRRNVVDDLEQEAPESRRPPAMLERRDAALAVREAIARLPERQKAAVLMAHFDGMSNPEIGEILQVGVRAVESLLSRARRQLRDDLAGLDRGNEGSEGADAGLWRKT